MDEVVALLRELVAIPSMNPFRTGKLEGGYGEARLAEHVAAWLRAAGLAAETQELAPGRVNVAAALDGPSGGAPLLFVAHLDTVPVEGMTVPPFEGAIRDGRLYGRGACDNKGSLAAMLVALRRVAAARSHRHPLLFAGTADEESGYGGIRAILGATRPEGEPQGRGTSNATEGSRVGGRGARAEEGSGVGGRGSGVEEGSRSNSRTDGTEERCPPERVSTGPSEGPTRHSASVIDSSFVIRHSSLPSPPSPLASFPPERVPWPPRAAIVGEPTGLRIVIAHRGVARWTLTTHGKSAHSAHPEQGINAIYRMAPVVADLEALAREVAGRPPHPLVGPPTLSVGTIRGGLSVNTVPDRCVIEVDRRLVPGESTEAAEAEIRAMAERRGATVEALFAAGTFEVPRDAKIVRLAEDAVTGVLGRAEVIGVAYATEAPEAMRAGIPAVVLGPGDAAQAHAADESIPLDQLEAAVRIYERLMISE